MPEELRDAVWAEFLEAISPLRDAGRMGALLVQFPRWIEPTRESAALIEEVRGRLEGWNVAVEFRNSEWFSERLKPRTLALLQRNELAYVEIGRAHV